jgi:hypothetical protein
VAGACAGCRSDGDCGQGDALFCDPEDATCRGCEQDAECRGRGLGAACLQLEGRCVQCDDAADCAGSGCDPRTNACSANATDSVSQCRACESDDDCAGGRACVAVSWEAAEVGTYCTFACPVLPDDCLLAVGASGYTCAAGTTRGGAAVDACLPARTTCEGWDEANTREGCQLSTECGAEGFDDGLCTDDICTYGCDDDPECPPGQSTCNGVVCRQ